jgi:NitT/TauT family transport system permease protein
LENRRNLIYRLRLELLNLGPFALVLAVWWSLTALEIIDPVFLPSPWRTFQSFLGLMSGEFFSQQLAPSSFRIGAAFLLSILIAAPVGIASSQIPLVARLVTPIFAFTRYLPVAAFVPLCILWFGIDDPQKIAVIVIGVMFQLTLLFAADTASVPGELVETGRTLGLTRFQILRRIVLPWSMPAIWDDLRISAGWAWSYLVLAELVAGNRGIGYFIVQSQRYLETDRVFAAIFFVGLLGALTDFAFRFSKTRLFRWL